MKVSPVGSLRGGGKGAEGVKKAKGSEGEQRLGGGGAEGSENHSLHWLCRWWEHLCIEGVRGRVWGGAKGAKGSAGSKCHFRLGFWVLTTCDHKRFDYNI